MSWKYNKAFCSPYIEARELESNGLDLKNGSDFFNILDSSNLIHNDLFCIEAPWFHYRDGYHYLFFSANWYDSPDYFTGTLTFLTQLWYFFLLLSLVIFCHFYKVLLMEFKSLLVLHSFTCYNRRGAKFFWIFWPI